MNYLERGGILMTDKELLIDYMSRFRLECHYRLDMVPGDIKELPMFMYTAAQEATKETMKKDLELDEEQLVLINRAEEFFLKTLQETDHYGETDDKIVEAIEEGQFSK